MSTPVDVLPRGDALVLNVNDHDGVRYMISRMLDRAGFKVAEAATGREAMEKVQTPADAEPASPGR